MITALSVAVLAQAEESTTELPAPPLVLGGGVFVALVILLLITLQFNKDR